MILNYLINNIKNTKNNLQKLSTDLEINSATISDYVKYILTSDINDDIMTLYDEVVKGICIIWDDQNIIK